MTRPSEYVHVVYAECWGDARATQDEHEAACQRATDWLTEHEGRELSITVRPGRSGRHSEIPGLYRVRADGSLVTARYDDERETPIARVHELLDAALEHALETWPLAEAAS